MTQFSATRRIEHALDGVIDFRGFEFALILFKKRCCRYRRIDQASIAYRVNVQPDLLSFFRSDSANVTLYLTSDYKESPKNFSKRQPISFFLLQCRRRARYM